MYENFDYNIGCLQSSGKKIDYLINGYENTGKEVNKLERHEIRTLLFALCTNDYSLALSFFEIGMKTDLFQSCGHC